jgi:DNA-binding response OmpR family regulator
MESGESVQDPAADSLAGKCVLLVEDEVLITTLLVEILEEQGMIVLGPASTLAHALLLAAEAKVDAAILDVNLGAETSFPVARLLRARGVPFFYTTAFASTTHREVAGEAFLPKPYGVRQLMEKLRQVISFVASHNVDAENSDQSEPRPGDQ